jgi:hypothetical protein
MSRPCGGTAAVHQTDGVRRMEKNKSWDDIPSLDGLAMDWEYKPESSKNRRSFIRLKMETVAKIFEVKEVFVRISTVRETCTARLLDLSEGGLSLGVPTLFEVDLRLKIGFFLGPVKIVSKAEVRHVRKVQGQYITGVRFVDLDKESAQYLKELYASQIFRHAL